MPAKLDKCVQKVMKTGKSKSDAFAICQSKQDTKIDGKESKNWKHVEFYSPINESFISNNKEFFIKGVAINETTTRNGITYISEELEKAAPSFRNKPILKDHNNSIESIVGRTTENVHFENTATGQGRIMFEAQIMDKRMQEMIKDGRIQNVSIGTMLEDLEEDEEAGTVTAIGMEGLEISLVAVPGDAGAGLTQALNESLKLKKDEILLTKSQTEEVMETEAEKLKAAEELAAKELAAKEEADKADEVEDKSDAEEKLKLAEAKIAEYEAKEAKENFKLAVAEEVKKQLEDAQPPVDETPAPEKPEDETEGTVGTEDPEEDSTDESFMFERSESGKGFELYRNYTGEGAAKFKRLCRD